MISSSTPQYQELLIDTFPWCLPLQTTLTMREIVVARLAGENNARHTEGGTEYGIEDLDEEGLQDGEGISTSSKAALMVSQKEERKLKYIQRTEEVLIHADGGRKEQDLMKENESILHHPSNADLRNETECEENGGQIGRGKQCKTY